MANKAKTNNQSNDSVVYKVPIAFAIMLFMIVLLQRLGRFYQTSAGYIALRDWFHVGAIGFSAVAAVCIALYFICRKSLVRSICRYGIVLAVLAAFSCWLLYTFWTTYLKDVYFLHAYVYCLYMVELLYGWEFFFYSLATCFAGFVFFRYSKGVGPNLNSIIPAAVLLLILAFTVYVANQGAKSNGSVQLVKKISLFPADINAVLLYVVCAIWAVCLIACFLFEAVFAYYCMFASIAFELIAAVYYTFQLK